MMYKKLVKIFFQFFYECGNKNLIRGYDIQKLVKIFLQFFLTPF